MEIKIQRSQILNHGNISQKSQNPGGVAPKPVLLSTSAYYYFLNKSKQNGNDNWPSLVMEKINQTITISVQS